jgi:hypothetical protein
MVRKYMNRCSLSFFFQIDSSKHQQRSSSIASSISTPSLSEQEQERDEISSTSSSRLSTKPFAVLQNVSPSKPSLQTEEALDLLDIPIKTNKKTQQNLLNDSLSSVSSYGDRSSTTTKKRSSVPRSSSPINNKQKSSSIKGNKNEIILQVFVKR